MRTILITAASVMTQEGHFVAGDKPNHISEQLKAHLVDDCKAAIYTSEAPAITPKSEVKIEAEKKSLPSSQPAPASPKPTPSTRIRKRRQ